MPWPREISFMWLEVILGRSGVKLWTVTIPRQIVGTPSPLYLIHWSPLPLSAHGNTCPPNCEVPGDTHPRYVEECLSMPHKSLIVCYSNPHLLTSKLHFITSSLCVWFYHNSGFSVINILFTARCYLVLSQLAWIAFRLALPRFCFCSCQSHRPVLQHPSATSEDPWGQPSLGSPCQPHLFPHCHWPLVGL